MKTHSHKKNTAKKMTPAVNLAHDLEHERRLEVLGFVEYVATLNDQQLAELNRRVTEYAAKSGA